MGSGASKRENLSDKLQSKERKTLLKTLCGHSGGINCMDISSNLLLTGSDDKTARLWNLDTFECKVVLEGHRGYVSCCKLWRKGFALTGSFDKTIRKWNSESGNCVLKLDRHSGVINRLLIYGNYLFSSSYDSNVLCWNLSNGEPCKIYKGHSKSILPMSYVTQPDNDVQAEFDIDKNSDSLITGSMDKTARVWSVSTASSLRTFRGHKGAVICLAVDLENSMLFTGSTDHTIRKWNLLAGTPLKVFKGHEGSVICLQMHHRLLYSASADTTARCWVAEFGDTTRKYTGHNHMVADMKYYHGIVYTGSGDCAVRAFDAKSGNIKKTFKGHKYPVNCLQPYYDAILSGSYDGTVKVWNIDDLINKGVGDSEISIGSFALSPSSVSRRKANINSPAISGIERNEKPLTSGRARSGTTRFETTNEVATVQNKQVRTRKPRAGRVGPANERMNGNNNSNKNGELDFGYLNDKLKDILEADDFWAESSNQSSSLSFKETTPSREYNRRNGTTNSGHSARERQSESNVASSSISTSAGSRAASLGFIKRDSSDFLNKRPRTESSTGSIRQISQTDLALVDKELQALSGVDTPNTSGYRTADNCSPSTPSTAGTDKPKSRQKSSVSFSPHVSLKDNEDWDPRSYRSSRIPTAVKSRHTDTRGSDRSQRSTTSFIDDPRRRIDLV